MDWKHVERKIANLLGGKRIPVTGRHEHAADIEHHTLAIEVKARKQLPRWLLRAMEQAEASAAGDKIPVAVLHQAGKPYAAALCVLRLRDIILLLGVEEK